MKVKEINKESKEFKPIRVEFTFESLDEIKSLIGYLNLPEGYVQEYYYSLSHNQYYPGYATNNFASIKINEIKKVNDSTLVFLNNIALSSEK